ncbi:MAG: ShlB/FhaC/HecB family hemolysin secretion/activation protein [Chthoniobacterales bacterium]
MFATSEKFLPPARGLFRASLLLLGFAAIASSEPCLGRPTEVPAELPVGSSSPDPAVTPAIPAANPPAPQSVQTLFIREYRVQGAHKLGKLEIEQAVYPYLGPGRTEQDVEGARTALEKAYKDKGYQAAGVQIPPQQARHGIVFLRVNEGVVGRLRVTGSRYFSLKQIKRNSPSLSEGRVVDFNAVTKDIVGLNQLPDRQVTPALRAGLEPGTVDIDLNVKDKLPIHGSVELNNRYSADTTELRINGSFSYGNLWQLGHTIGASFQVSPLDLSEVKVFTGYYLARFAGVPWFSLLVSGTKQDSNVNTLGGIGVVGNGEVIGGRAILTLPMGKDFFHSITFGLDYKHFNQDVTLTGSALKTPVTYYPFSIAYGATWVGKSSTTELNASVVYHPRGLGSNEAEFDFNRFRAGGSFFYFRGDLAQTRELPAGLQLFGKLQGQVADQPLLNSEQFSGGGLGTVRGYLESETLGDNAIFASLELRSPSVISRSKDKQNEWRFYGFVEGGAVTLNEPLPQQESGFVLASLGVGTRFRVLQHLNGSLDLGVPLSSQIQTSALDPRLTFRLWGDF